MPMPFKSENPSVCCELRIPLSFGTAIILVTLSRRLGSITWLSVTLSRYLGSMTELLDD